MKILKYIIQSPILNLIGGLTLIVTSGFEVFEVSEGLSEIKIDADIGSHHVFH